MNESETNVGINLGGGVKISLVGPLRLRLDYRVLDAEGGRAVSAPAAVLRGDQPEVLRRGTHIGPAAQSRAGPDAVRSGRRAVT